MTCQTPSTDDNSMRFSQGKLEIEQKKGNIKKTQKGLSFSNNRLINVYEEAVQRNYNSNGKIQANVVNVNLSPTNLQAPVFLKKNSSEN